MLKRFVGKEVKISITSWGGPYVLVEGVFPKVHSRLLVASRPLEASSTHNDVIVFARKCNLALFDRVNLGIRRRFTRAFMQYDIDKLSGIRYQPEGMTDRDIEMARFFLWIATLPVSDYEDRG